MNIRALCVSALVIVGCAGVSAAPRDQVVYDEDVRLVSFPEDLPYPASARTAKVEGDVVVSVTMNHDGRVKNATAVSGPKLLIAMAIDNAMTWRFVPNRQRRAVLVYEFRIEGACAAGATTSLFRQLHSNIVSVIACLPSVR